MKTELTYSALLLLNGFSFKLLRPVPKEDRCSSIWEHFPRGMERRVQYQDSHKMTELSLPKLFA